MKSSDDSPRARSQVLADTNLRQINSFAISLLQQRTLDDLLWSLVENIGELLGYEDCVIYLLEGDSLSQAASFAAKDPDLRHHQRDFRLGLGEGVIGRVAQTGESRIVRDTRQDPNYVSDDFAGLSELAVPITFEDQILGVLDSESKQPDAYDETDRATLQFIANIAASRIASALADRERNRAQAEKAKMVEELEAKNTELERFAYTVSHELKAPLVTIQGFLGLLEKDLVAGDVGRRKDYIGRIRNGTRQMALLLDDLLTLSRVGRQLNPTEDIDLSSLAHEAAARVHGRIRERGVQVEIADDLPVVRGDRSQLLSVLQNLIDNAVRFMGAQPEPRITIGRRQQHSEPVCFVRDNGIGIDRRYQDRIFGLFERLSKEVDGTGIGLALARRIVELHGGRIWVESAGEGAGSAFCFTLPTDHACPPEV